MNQLKKLLSSLSAQQLTAIVICAAAVVAGVVWFSRWQRESGLRPLYTSLAPEDAMAMVQKLKESGVDTRPFFFPMSHFPMYAMLGADNPVAASLSQDGFNLPTFVGMTKSQIAQVCDTFLGALAEQRG